jgi:hypothetical protein
MGDDEHAYGGDHVCEVGESSEAGSQSHEDYDVSSRARLDR